METTLEQFLLDLRGLSETDLQTKIAFRLGWQNLKFGGFYGVPPGGSLDAFKYTPRWQTEHVSAYSLEIPVDSEETFLENLKRVVGEDIAREPKTLDLIKCSARQYTLAWALTVELV